MANELPELSAAETLLLTKLMERFGLERYAWSRVLFDNTYACLGQAVKAYDASAFLASCAMTRAALEGALHTFVSMKRMEGSGSAWRWTFDENKHGEVHSLSLKELISRVITEGGLTEADRPAMERIANDGDLSLHLVEKQFERTIEQLKDTGKGRQLAPAKWWPGRSDARENISATIELIHSLLKVMRIGEPEVATRNETATGREA